MHEEEPENPAAPRALPPETERALAAHVAAGKYVEAAALAEASGDLRRAIALLERIWEFRPALDLARRLGDGPLAVRLALDAGDAALAVALADGIAPDDRPALAAARDLLIRRGRWVEAARLAERLGESERAGELYERGGAWMAAAAAFEQGGDWQRAGRLYGEVRSTRLEAGDEAGAANASLALGALLGRLGRTRDAISALQAAARVPATREAAGRRLCLELLTLGLPHAADEVARRLHESNPELPADALALAELELGEARGGPIATAPLRRFRDLELLGAGALGRAYAAHDSLLGKTVALKVLSVGPDASELERQSFERFVREAEASSRLDHPNIVRLLDVDTKAGILVLEHLPGGTLGDRLETQGRLTPAAARRLALDILAALTAAHRAGIVHRDVKPANIFFDAAGNAKLADFGAAHLADFGGTQTAGFIGSLGYLSPEQISGAPIGPTADLYGLAVTLFESLTGRRPFLGPDIVAQHLGDPPPRPSTLAPHLAPIHDAVLLRALAKAPEARFASALEMARLVETWPESREGASAPSPSAIPEPASTPAPSPESPLGPTVSGMLFSARDPATLCPLLIERLDDPLAAEERRRIQLLARAGGPHVQRILALPDDRTIVYEHVEGARMRYADLPPEERSLLGRAWSELAPADVAPARDHPVARTLGGPVILLVTARPDGDGYRAALTTVSA